MASEMDLAALLHGNGPVAKAFEKVTQGGCKANDLKCWLLKLQAYPLKRERSYFPVQRRRKLERIAADLDHAAAELGSEAGVWIFALGDLRGNILGSTKPVEALASLRAVARITRIAIQNLRNVTTTTASRPITAIVKEISHRTGRPHYAQMATLIGAACGRPQFSEGELKMLISRRRK